MSALVRQGARVDKCCLGPTKFTKAVFSRLETLIEMGNAAAPHLNHYSHATRVEKPHWELRVWTMLLWMGRIGEGALKIAKWKDRGFGVEFEDVRLSVGSLGDSLSS